ncbi:hypothetical protein [Maribacter sp.]|uniref:hypothetical protein n=1 Tax=Maribacter sp. TaxID=1897614 RepID=UPI0025B882A1|nr:hypothetical protein [Maribacter sp.]
MKTIMPVLSPLKSPLTIEPIIFAIVWIIAKTSGAEVIEATTFFKNNNGKKLNFSLH